MIVSGGSPEPAPATRLAVAETYDSATDAWATVNYMPTMRGGDGTASVTVNSKAYTFGGFVDGTVFYSNVVEAYEGSIVGRSMSRAVTYSNLVYLVGAQPGGTAPANDLQKYNPTTDAWLTLNNMPTARANLGWEKVGTKVYPSRPFKHHNQAPSTNRLFVCSCSLLVASKTTLAHRKRSRSMTRPPTHGCRRMRCQLTAAHSVHQLEGRP